MLHRAGLVVFGLANLIAASPAQARPSPDGRLAADAKTGAVIATFGVRELPF